MSGRLPGRPSSISSTLRVPPSARVSTSCNTQPIHDPPAGNGPAGHIAPSAHPQSLNTPLTSLREKLIKIGAKVIRHGRYVAFQLAEVAVPRQMFAEILSLIARLRAPRAPA